MRDDARYHLMASVHHAAKASAYGKLGYHDDQVRHAVRALDHKLMFGTVLKFSSCTPKRRISGVGELLWASGSRKGRAKRT